MGNEYVCVHVLYNRSSLKTLLRATMFLAIISTCIENCKPVLHSFKASPFLSRVASCSMSGIAGDNSVRKSFRRGLNFT